VLAAIALVGALIVGYASSDLFDAVDTLDADQPGEP
jgi:hypothetical protein